MSTIKKNSIKIIESNKEVNVSSIEDSILVNKNMSIRFLSDPKMEIKGFNFNNFLLSKNFSEKYSFPVMKTLPENLQRREFPMKLSPICFHSIGDDQLEVPGYLSWDYIQSEINK
jgi:hypothetical protein